MQRCEESEEQQEHLDDPVPCNVTKWVSCNDSALRHEDRHTQIPPPKMRVPKNPFLSFPCPTPTILRQKNVSSRLLGDMMVIHVVMSQSMTQRVSMKVRNLVEPPLEA